MADKTPEQIELEERLQKVINDRIKVEKELATLSEGRLKANRQEEIALKTSIEYINEQLDLLTRGRDLYEAQKKELEQVEAKIKAIKDLGEDLDQQDQDRLDALEKIEDKLEEQIEKTAEIVKLDEESAEHAKNYLANLKKIKELQAKVSEYGDRFAKTLAMSLGISDSWKKSLLGTFAGLIKDGAKGGDIMKSITKSMKEQFSVGNIMASIFAKIVESTIAVALAQDKALASFNRTNTAAGELDDQITNLQRSSLAFGLSMDDAGKITGDLRSRFADFTTLSKTSQNEFMKLTAIMEANGASASDLATTFNLATKSMGFTETQSKKLALELAALARSVGRSMGEINKEFNEFMKRGAAFGKAAPKIFGNLEKMAKNAGVEVSALTGLAGQFETFQDSAQTIGRLNAVLKTNIDSNQFINMTMDEQISLLAKQLRAATGGADALGMHGVRAVANAIGVQDLALVTKLLNNELDNGQKLTMEQIKEMEYWEKRAKANTDVGKKLNAVFQSFAIIVRPVVTVLKDVLDFIVELNDVFPIATIFVGALTLALGFHAARLMALAIWYPITTLMSKLKMDANFGEAVSAETAAVANTKLGLSMTATGPAAMGAVPFMLAFGLAITLVGAGVLLAGAGIALMADGIVKMAAVADEALTVFAGLSMFVLALAAAAVAVGFGGTMALYGLLAITAGLVALAAVLFFINTDDLKSIATIFESISNFGDTAETSISGVTGEIKKLVEQVDKLNQIKALAITAMIGSVAKLAPQAAPVAAGVQGATTITRQVVAGENVAVAAPATTTRAAAPVARGRGGDSGAIKKPIRIEIKERVLADFILDVTKKGIADGILEFSG